MDGLGRGGTTVSFQGLDLSSAHWTMGRVGGRIFHVDMGPAGPRMRPRSHIGGAARLGQISSTHG